MKILLAPNNFKGSLNTKSFCETAAKVLKKHSLAQLPVADGGDGLIDVFKTAYPKSKEYKTKALNAVYKNKTAPFLILPDKKTCVIETAKICGLGELKKQELSPLAATSFGIGEVIKAAVKKGAKTFYIGLGGVGTNDAGAGMAAALGIRFYDKNNRFISLGAAPLAKLARIEKPKNFLKGINFYGITDVKNPLLGKKGSAYIYGPQKGATKKQVLVLEQALTNYAKIIKSDFGININLPRCGAAGAIAAGVFGLLNGELIDGADFVLKQIKAEEKIKKADIVFTGEGKLDKQTFFGKAPAAVCALAKKHGKPVVFICGINEVKNKALLKKHNIFTVKELSAFAPSKKAAFKNPIPYLKKALAEAENEII